jgi:isocitrate/isopropylmalate dehydrogenase
MGAHRIAVIGGNGIGRPEVIEAGCRVLAFLAEIRGANLAETPRVDS